MNYVAVLFWYLILGTMTLELGHGVYSGFRTGTIKYVYRSDTCRRREAPVTFWLEMVVNILVVSAILAVLLVLTVHLYRDGIP